MDNQTQAYIPNPPFNFSTNSPLPDILGLCLGIRDNKRRPWLGIRILKNPLPKQLGGKSYAVTPCKDSKELRSWAFGPPEPPDPLLTTAQAVALDNYCLDKIIKIQ